MNILITEKEFHEYRKLQQENDKLKQLAKSNYETSQDILCEESVKWQQEKEELIKWLEENVKRENHILKSSLTQESKINSLTIIACFEQVLSKLKEN